MLTELNRLGRTIADSKDLTTLTPEAELELIRKVQEDSCSEAFTELCEGYTRGLSGCLKGFQAGGEVSMDDAWAEILVGFYENVSNYDLEQPTKRLAYGVKSLKYRLYGLRDDHTAGIEIPSRTMDRYKALNKRYDGDILQMFKNSNEDQGLAQSTLLFIHELVSGSASFDVLPEMDYPEEARPGLGDRDYDFIALAFAAIADDVQATDVIWLSFNFDQPDVKRKRTDGDVAEETGLTRVMIQRIRAGALQRIREVLLGGGLTDTAVLAA